MAGFDSVTRRFLPGGTGMPEPANHDLSMVFSEPKLLSWILRMSSKKRAAGAKADAAAGLMQELGTLGQLTPEDDWQVIHSLCGYSMTHFAEAGVGIPLKAAEVEYFRRNHREMDMGLSRDFVSAKSNLPKPLCELYTLYRFRALMDAEASFFVCQATGSVRVAQTMADLQAIGGFAHGHEAIAYVSQTFSVATAFDTSEIIDLVNAECLRRMQLPIEDAEHLLKLTPDEMSVCAAGIVEAHLLTATEFLEKANLLAEARQDVNRLEASRQFATAVAENDIPLHKNWATRLMVAYSRIFHHWGIELTDEGRKRGANAPS